MTRILAHRGPDGEGVWLDGAIGLGNRRLAIRDPGEAGRQPMRDDDGRATVVFNGEIYNVEALMGDIVRETGWVFRSRCDTEVVLAGWLAWEDALFTRLDGMFALAVWDARAGRLVLARDGAGIKPLYLHRSPAALMFASEIKSFAAAGADDPVVEPAALHAFLAQGHVAPDRTLFAHIRPLAPGGVLSVDAGGMRESRFWKPSRSGEIRRLGEAVEAFQAVWSRVVPDHLASDVPVGVLQSGGIDSSLISTGLGDAPDIPLFTAGFSEASHDETANARAVAKAAGRELQRVPVDETEGAETTFLATVRHFDGQLADASAFAVWRLCAAVARRVKVVLAGDGADEFFGGYPTYRASRLAERLRPFLPRILAGGLGRAFSAGGGGEGRLSRRQVAGRFLSGLAQAGPAHVQWRRLVPRHLLGRLYGHEMAPFLDQDPLAAYGRAIADGDGALVDRCLLADQRHYLPADMLLKVDAMSMAHGLEVRVPFLDRRVMDLAGRIHADLLCPLGGPDKKVLRQALRQAGGPADVARAPKRGFNLPVAAMLRGALRPLGERFLVREADRLAGFLRPEGVGELWAAHDAGQADHGYALWPILGFAAWLALSEEARGRQPARVAVP